ncbi:uncharacterized protein LOC142180792 [Nicotiana tabacum]|uniref:Uncharacterized protein LOC142180792 n=1 Tax=Nicotiana tabacum TaxID=4097 RepID=A0AC58UHJ7_TOBAC
MNFIIWNCGGAQSDDFRRNFRSLLDYNRPSLVVLLETHCQSYQTVKEDFNFNGLIEVSAIGQSGGLLFYGFQMRFMWNKWPLPQEIHCHIHVLPFPFTFLFTAIYASTDLATRQALWQNIMHVYDHYKSHWLLGGDFNKILHANDKFGGLSINNSRANKLLDCLNYSRLTDLGYKGSRYTCTNGRHNSYNILERIDRITTNYDWLK